MTDFKLSSLYHFSLNARWVSAAHSCWLYHNNDCSGDEKLSLPMMEAPFALDKFENSNENFNSMSMPANGKAVYCTSQSHSP
ncbi:hypothetical protein N7478_008831 [Penicillium angulare]|uniref:uncharacterized protein n=1 Tax=Penicillium angulare TaxID=116970 RepID=UPI0025423C83|nr:uncharacterized protein N7478_008831 [Penicillium angulare]KAJ5273706.1 hypothetical protein N7478_008831 [Penicillium angulare]